MKWLSYEFKLDPEGIEILSALASGIEGSAIWEKEETVDLTIPESFCDEFESLLEAWPSINGSFLHKHWVEDQNWNRLWESNFDPVIIPGICSITADFHQIEITTPYHIRIQPAMAFGTGHHDTTFMMIQAMDQIVLKDAVVLDFGCAAQVSCRSLPRKWVQQQFSPLIMIRSPKITC